MIFSCYLKVKAGRGFSSDKKSASYFKAQNLTVTKNKPDTGSDEIAIKLDLEIPNSLFMKPALVFKVTVPEEACSLPEIEAKVTDNLAELLAQELGTKVRLEVG